MASKRLGRGLGALVALPPAADDGTARIAETIRGGSEHSVLALSGRSVEDFFRPIPSADVVPNRPAQQPAVAVAAAPVPPRPAAAAAAVATPPTPPVAAPATPAPPTQSPLTRSPPTSAPPRAEASPRSEPEIEEAAVYEDEPLFFDPAIEDVLLDVSDVVAPADGVVAAAHAGVVTMPEQVSEAPPEVAPTPAEVPAPPAPAAETDHDVFLDETVGGSFLPDVDLD